MGVKKFTLTIAGASGVVGRHIIRFAQNEGWEIRILSRSYHEDTDDIKYYAWNPDKADLSGNHEAVCAVDGADFLINLGGSSIAGGRLNKKNQSDILMSRLNTTNALIEAYKKCKHPPGVWGQASAMGFYGDTKEENITENSVTGNLFLSNVCVQWENAARQITQINPEIRLIISRFGVVLAKDAPGWQKITKGVRMLGGAIGSGNQWISWIDADDLAGAFFYLFHQKNTSGIYNFTSPDPVRQKVLAKKVGEFYRKPYLIRIPKFMIRLMMGKTADELLLASCKALPDKLLNDGYRFAYPDIGREINHLLK